MFPLRLQPRLAQDDMSRLPPATQRTTTAILPCRANPRVSNPLDHWLSMQRVSSYPPEIRPAAARHAARRRRGAWSVTCTICGDQLNRTRGARAGRCGTCSTYRYRHGHDRPDDLIIKQTDRDIERALTRRGNSC